MAAKTQDVALRKRQLIDRANKVMFIWVAVASAIVGVAVVASLFLVKKAVFNEKVLYEKSKTAKVLANNNKVVDELKNQIRVLNTNEKLKSVMAPGEKEPIQVVLDALPSEANSSAFGASLQKKFLSKDGLTIESLIVDPVAGVESEDTAASKKAKAKYRLGNSKISFRFAVAASSANVNALKALLQDLEHSIRPINVTSAAIEAQAQKIILRVSGVTYYEPAKTAELSEKVVKP